MKPFRTTLIFALIVGVIAVFAWMEFQKSEEEKQAELTANRIIKLGDAEVVEVKLKRTDEDLHLKKEQGSWQLLEPVQDRASDSEVSSLISTITGRDGEPVEVEGVINWEEYGLKDPGAQIQLMTAEGVAHELHVSRIEAFDGSYFIRKGDELLISDDQWGRVVQRATDSLREKRILASFTDPQEIFIQYPRQRQELHLVEKEGEWQLSSKKDMKVSTAQVEDFLNELRELKATGFVAESKGEQDLKEYGLHRPEMTVRLVFAEDQESFFEVSPPEDEEVYAITGERDTIFKMSKSAAESVEWMTEDFRDKQAPFVLDVAMVGELEVTTEDGVTRVSKDGSQWSLEGGGPDQKLSEESLQSLFTEFKSLEAYEFLDGAVGKGFAASQRQLLFKGINGENLLKVQIGDEYEVEEGGKKTLLYYVRSNASKDDVGVKVADVNALPWEGLVQTPDLKEPMKEESEEEPEASAQ